MSERRSMTCNTCGNYSSAQTCNTCFEVGKQTAAQRAQIEALDNLTTMQEGGIKDLHSQLEAQQRQIEELESTEKMLRNDVGMLRDESARRQRTVADLEAKQTSYQKTISELVRTNECAAEKIDDLNAQCSTLCGQNARSQASWLCEAHQSEFENLEQQVAAAIAGRNAACADLLEVQQQLAGMTQERDQLQQQVNHVNKWGA
jgi:chromosome segregation ATPase